ncbi:DUF4136 domain-containing protein [Fulvivirga maritima]|uniref:DUF4136 domain-containing protein n=1 Tax=Fulvivirga maritima TaxID=2904247 RepID=UPI001F22F267|nr:DUF4136 domain-containing protein [Fulvivirga maritima]UII27921.1 DUF4136 domain-containing protein [Fulvivirga maritima]
MKKIVLSLTLSIFFISTYAQRIYSEKSTGAINGNYETFALLDPQQSADPGSAEALVIESDNMQSVWVFTNENYPGADVKNSIKTSIKQEFIERDYDFNTNNPDLLVSFMVFDKEGKIKGHFNDNTATAGVKTPETIEFDKGTLLITVTDYESGKTVWQGFENNAFDNSTITEADAMKAVTDILQSLDLDSPGTL